MASGDEDRARRGADDGWLGLAPVGPGRWSLELVRRLTRFDGKLYGGTGLAMVVAAFEAESGRPTLWATAQFVSSAEAGAEIEVAVDTLAAGRRTSQLRLTATCEGRVLVTGVGSAGDPRGGGVEVQVPTMPEVPGPDECPVWAPRIPFRISSTDRGWIEVIEMREVPDHDGHVGELGPTRGMWTRLRDRPMTRAGLAFVADIVPSSVMRAAGRAGAGTSLDNSMRYGSDPDTDWVLVELDPLLATAGYLHGAARLWTPDGRLVAMASQTAAAVRFD